ncbi:MAG: Xaa-Pro peptidase family protein, partial [Coriobacteriia bacterium]|nr:Xaa-Pro peptidase family protein [Coriobacteriia bacterium]
MTAVSGDFAPNIDQQAGETEPPCKARLSRLRRACFDQGVDAFYVRGTTNIQWLTGFDRVFDEEQAHALIVTPKSAVLHTDSRYSTACRNAAAGTPVQVDESRAAHGRVCAQVWEQDVAPGLDLERGERGYLAIEDSMTLADYAKLRTAFGLDDDLPASEYQQNLRRAPHMPQTSQFVFNLRAVKDAAEIKRMRAAQAITDAAFAHIIAFMRPGMTEREVQLELDDFMLRHGADGLAFPSIVATGANGASPHAIPGNTLLEAGQCVVMDFGARYAGYCSDMTRTVFLGQPQGRMLDAWHAMRRANEEVQELIRPGVTGRAMHQHAEDVLDQEGFGGKMGHGLGHGVG